MDKFSLLNRASSQPFYFAQAPFPYCRTTQLLCMVLGGNTKTNGSQIANFYSHKSGTKDVMKSRSFTKGRTRN
eukprot:687583-Prorocentrum_lima.AAC.1